MTGAASQPGPRLTVNDRISALENALTVIQARIGAVSPASSDDPDAAEAPVLTELRAPKTGSKHPAGWRTLTDAQRRNRWLDLAGWVDWLIDAYRLHPRSWGSWWTCPGASEELAHLRSWHHELVDVAVANRSVPNTPWDTLALIDWYRGEHKHRHDLARARVDWHDAMWRCIARLVGTTNEQKPLLVRDSEPNELADKVRTEAAAERAEALIHWLDKQCAPPRSHHQASA